MTTNDGHYEVQITEQTVLTMEDAKFRQIWHGEIVFVSADGALTRTGITNRSLKDRDPSKRRVRASLNIQLGRLRSHLQRTGRRWEVEQQEARDKERAARKAKAEAEKRVRDAAPDMLTALLSLVENPACEAARQAARSAINKAQAA